MNIRTRLVVYTPNEGSIHIAFFFTHQTRGVYTLPFFAYNRIPIGYPPFVKNRHGANIERLPGAPPGGPPAARHGGGA